MSKTNLLIINGVIHTLNGIIDHGHILITGGKIKAIGNGDLPSYDSSTEILDAKGKLVLPGFIDIHVNGGGGSLTIDGSLESIKNIAQAHSRFGTTAMIPTTISADEKILIESVSIIAEASEQFIGGASILGVHLEGPFLNPAKRGAHRKEFLRSPSKEYFDKLYNSAKGKIKILALAPELDMAFELIKHANQHGVIASLAHSEADYKKTREAIEAGLRLCAHIFNGMPPLTHRSPGPIGAFLTSKDTFVELISDGFHVHPAVMEIIIKAKGPDGVIIVTDAVTPAGTSMKTFNILGTQLIVRDNSCFTPDGNLAGSALTMNKAIKVIIDSTSTSFTDALKMASLNPAKLLDIDKKKGSLEIDKDGDVVIADSDLNVYTTIVEGNLVYHQA